MTTFKVTYLPGDGIGPEVGAAAVAVLGAVENRFGCRFEIAEKPIGGIAIDTLGDPCPDETLEACRDSDAVLLGAVGGPKWSDPAAKVRPEQGLLKIRKELGLFANVRPVAPPPALADKSPLKPDVLKGVDLVVVRELTGGIYFGDKGGDAEKAHDLCTYTRGEIERVVRAAARMAQARRGKLTSVDKANVLATSRLWRTVTNEVMAAEFPDVELEHILVDAAAMYLIQRPADFDVIVTENMFGDILTDEASVLAGSMGILPSASLGDGKPGLFEPIHGSAPDIAGQGKANPLAMILSTAMMLSDIGRDEAAKAVRAAVAQVIDREQVTPDLGGTLTTGGVVEAVTGLIADGPAKEAIAS